MAVCKYFLQGNCRYGDNCRFEHPGNQSRAQPANRFAPLQPPSDRSSRQRHGYTGREDGDKPPYLLDPEIIERELKNELPLWIFSAFGPGRDAPRQLFGGYPLEQSFEEMRVLYYMGMASGNTQPAIDAERELTIKAHQQIRNVLNDLRGAVKYIIDGEKELQNRWWVSQSYRGQGPGQLQAQNNPKSFGNLSSVQSSFGQPSSIGGPTSRPGFGAAVFQQQPVQVQSQSQQTPFGQPSQLGSTSSFGKTSALGQAPGFGKPSGLGSLPSFGQPSAPTGQSSFAAPFGQGSNAAQAPPFGRTESGAGSSFGQPTSSAAAFGTRNLGTGAASSGPFSFPKPQVAQAPSTNTSQSPFGLPTGTISTAPYPPPARPTINGAFGANSGPLNSGGIPRTGTAAAANAASPFAPQTNGAYSNPSELLKGPVSNAATPPLSSYVTRDHAHRLRTFKGQPVTYVNDIPFLTRPGDRSLERIWFPEGSPPANKDTECEEEDYNEQLQEAYKALATTATFKDGIMPEVPPKRAWVRFDV